MGVNVVLRRSIKITQAQKGKPFMTRRDAACDLRGFALNWVTHAFTLGKQSTRYRE
jgi:hypothetical protein